MDWYAANEVSTAESSLSDFNEETSPQQVMDFVSPVKTTNSRFSPNDGLPNTCDRRTVKNQQHFAEVSFMKTDTMTNFVDARQNPEIVRNCGFKVRPAKKKSSGVIGGLSGSNTRRTRTLSGRGLSVIIELVAAENTEQYNELVG